MVTATAAILWFVALWTANAHAQESADVSSIPAPTTYAAAKASFRVLYANYGGQIGEHHYIIDVTDLTMRLLSKRGWLKVNNDEMHGDPRPGKGKWLYMDYEVLGKEMDYTVKEHSGLTLRQLIVAAKVLPPGQ